MEKGSSCKNCGKYPFCEKQGQVCEDWRKQQYTYIQKIDDKHYILRRIN